MPYNSAIRRCTSQQDLLDAPGDPVPPLIGGYRPDIIARCTAACLKLIIAEAKTDGDIDNQHTRSQIGAFLDHLDATTTSTRHLHLGRQRTRCEFSKDGTPLRLPPTRVVPT